MVRSTTRTAVTDIWKEGILLNPTGALTQVVDGTLSEDLLPASLVLEDPANDQWIKADASTAAHSLQTLAVIGYKKRVRASTNALVLITDQWDISEPEDKMAPIITDGFVICLADDPNAYIPAKTAMILSTNVGAVKIGTGGGEITVGTLADYMIDDDTYCILAIGAYMGKLFSFDEVL